MWNPFKKKISPTEAYQSNFFLAFDFIPMVVGLYNDRKLEEQTLSDIKNWKGFINNRLKPNMKFEQIENNSGSIIEINNEKVGIYKDKEGKIYAVKPICTHLGCLLSWNDVDKTWDCPCHGSRFSYRGENLYDPALKNLEIYNLD